jgi:aminopeptidase N
MLAGRTFRPGELLRIFVNVLADEQEETNLKLLSGYISTLFWEFTTAPGRQQYAAQLERQVWDALEKQTAPNNKKLLFKIYQDIYTSGDAGKRMYAVWQQQQAPAQVKLAEEDYISLALTLALKSDTVNNIIAQQRDRLKDNDKKDRLNFLIPALSVQESDRDQFFNNLRSREGRSKESWVAAGLAYLHHPLRQTTSAKYLPETLNLLEDIQRTGDIFFPVNWLNAIWNNYQDAAAWKVVSAFLDAHPDYNPKLKNKILQATDNLHRAQQLLQQ